MKASESLDLDTNEWEIAKRGRRFQIASYRNIARPRLLVVRARPGSFDESMRQVRATTMSQPRLSNASNAKVTRLRCRH
jgi:hypothetical protein